jgi:transcription antitermination factor NusG
MAINQAGWYLVYTRPRQERKLCRYLSENGIENMLPLRKVVKHRYDRKVCCLEPIFPSYVFVYIRDRMQYYEVMDGDGYLYFLKDGKRIAEVSQTVIDNVKLISGIDTDIEISDVDFKVGSRMIISQGPLIGLNCELVGIGNEEKILVRIELLRRNILISVDRRKLMRA